MKMIIWKFCLLQILYVKQAEFINSRQNVYMHNLYDCILCFEERKDEDLNSSSDEERDDDIARGWLLIIIIELYISTQ